MPNRSVSPNVNANNSELGQWIAKLRQIPNDSREFAVDLRRAKLEFGIGTARAEELMARELPHEVIDGEPHFATTDLHFIGLRLGCAVNYLSTLRTWVASLTASQAAIRPSLEVNYLSYASEGTAVEVLAPALGWMRGQVGSDRIVGRFEAAPKTQWPTANPALKEILLDISSLDFCWVPKSLVRDVQFTRETRLSDCAAASFLLADKCAHIGVLARTAFGLLLAVPFSITHSWVEVSVGDDWLPLDPLLLGLLARHSNLDPELWPPTRSPGGVLLRLADQETPIVMANGERLGLSIPTRTIE